MVCWRRSGGERVAGESRSEEARVNKGLSLGLIVLGVVLVIFAPIEHYVVQIKMQHLASAILGLGVLLLVLGVGLLLMGRRAAA